MLKLIFLVNKEVWLVLFSLKLSNKTFRKRFCKAQVMLRICENQKLKGLSCNQVVGCTKRNLYILEPTFYVHLNLSCDTSLCLLPILVIRLKLCLTADLGKALQRLSKINRYFTSFERFANR